MNLETKRNQQFTKLNLEGVEEKLNELISHLDKKHKPSEQVNIVEDEAHKFDGISYELKSLSCENLTKSTNVTNLVAKLSQLIIPQEITDSTTTTSTTTTTTTKIPSLIPERDFYFKKGHSGREVPEKIITDEPKKRGGFQKGHTIHKKSENEQDKSK